MYIKNKYLLLRNKGNCYVNNKKIAKIQDVFWQLSNEVNQNISIQDFVSTLVDHFSGYSRFHHLVMGNKHF